jgi:formylglycine-generating enzyme required for sulfatase activity
MTNCGASSESCCTSLEVACGTYDRSAAAADPASVSGFRLDKYPVTVGRFRQFVSAALLPDGGAGWTPAAGSGKHTHLNGGLGLAAAPNVDAGQTYEPGWDTSDNAYIAPTNANLACWPAYSTWTDVAGAQETLPMNCVNWYESYAFCIWDGGFLPSESEWEYAAAGGSEQRDYPWGTTAPGTSCPGTGCEYAIYDCDYPSGTGTGSCTGVANIAPVGTATLGVGLWGQLDLDGEIMQWNLDYYALIADPCIDCVQLTPPSMNPIRVVRGDAFDEPALGLLPPFRGAGPPRNRNYFAGFRCARTP